MRIDSTVALTALALILTLALPRVSRAETPPIVIAVPEQTNPTLAASVDDLRSYLTRSTGRPTALGPSAEADVVLERLDPQAAKDSAVAGMSREAYHLEGKADGRVVIRSQSPLGLTWGIYDYLRALGFRWLLPGEAWTVVPELTSVTLDVDRVSEPVTPSRRFFVNGGFGGRLAVDPDMQVRAAWRDWQRRQKFDGPRRFAGHAGGGFNRRHRDVLEANPRMLAEVDGQRQPWSKAVKPCYSNAALIELFVEDRLADMQRLVDRDPEAPIAHGVSVDPADGGGHCTCSDCLALGGVSDRVFSLANHVARALAERFPGRVATLYAYHQHAAVPEIELEPNVAVMVIPYGFQRTGLRPEQLMEAWSRKVDRLAVYDYWSNTDWAYDQPTTSLFHRAGPRVREWQSFDMQAVMIETTGSAGAVGPVLWVVSRMLWGDEREPAAILAEFCDDAFGDAAPPMLRMLSRWHERFLLNNHELALCYRDLAEADRLNADPAVQARLDDVKRYVHYLRLWHEYLLLIERSPERLAVAIELIRYLWRVHHSTMIHSYRLAHLIMLARERPAMEQIKRDWYWNDHDLPVWRTIKPHTSEELEALMADGRARYRPVAYDARTFSQDYVPIPRGQRFTGGAGVKAGEMVGTSLTNGLQTFAVYLSQSPARFRVDYTGRDGGPDYPGTTLRLLDEAGQEVDRHLVPSDGKTRSVVLSAPGRGLYRLRVEAQVHYRLAFPATLPSAQTSPLISVSRSGPLYFYVPPGQKYVAFHERSFVRPVIVDGSGTERPIHGMRGLISVPVPPGQDGRVWSIRDLHGPYPVHFINLPSLLSLSPHGLLTPRETLGVAARRPDRTDR